MIVCYIDPGAGSILMQVLLASMLAVGVFFKSIKNIFSYLKNYLFKGKKN